jgi:hypothetical protein
MVGRIQFGFVTGLAGVNFMKCGPDLHGVLPFFLRCLPMRHAVHTGPLPCGDASRFDKEKASIFVLFRST